jgi:hypothetical protein
VVFRVRSVVSDDSDPAPHAAKSAVTVTPATTRVNTNLLFFIHLP